MARKSSAANLLQRVTSGATGGASTLRGVQYQIRYAVLQALNLISIAKHAPHISCSIALEPRAPADDTVTAWDVETTPPPKMIEAKLNPTRADITEWGHRINQHRAAGTPNAYTLVYAQEGGPLLATLKKALRLATEAGADVDRFKKLVAVEAFSLDVIVEAFDCSGPDSLFELLRRMELEHISEERLNRDLEFFARCLAGDKGSELIEHLVTKFMEGGTKRIRYSIQELIEGIEARGLVLHSPAQVAPNLPHDQAATLFLLQRCPVGLPSQVLGQAIDRLGAEVDGAVAPLLAAGIVSRHGNGLLRVVPLSNQIAVQNGGDVIANGLTALLSFTKSCSREAARAQVRNILELSKLCVASRPRSVVPMFARMQGVLKSIGNKHLVLDAAELSIEAANRVGSDEEATRARALALICGRSWVYQRVQRLGLAREFAEESLALGRDIGWSRNTAFCLKCIGRLLRMEAESSGDVSQRRELLRQSAEHLHSAIIAFEEISESGEVGDCWSLLARTHLVTGDLDEADGSMSRAFDAVLPNGSKDHLDLLILAGDLHLAKGNAQAAEAQYSEVFNYAPSDDFQKSEIIARAYFRRGVSRTKVNLTDSAKGDFRKATDVWTSLEEPLFAAQAEWRHIRVSDPGSTHLLEMLEADSSDRVRVRAYKIYQQEFSSSPGVIERRAKPTPRQIDRILADARKQVAMEPTEWAT